MTDLEYKIGGLNVDTERMQLGGIDPYEDTTHLFVVQATNNLASIYISKVGRHTAVARDFDLTGEIVGGGSFYTNEKKELFLGDYSGAYGAIPKKVAQSFAELISPALKNLGLEIKSIVVNPNEKELNPFWEEIVFI